MKISRTTVMNLLALIMILAAFALRMIDLDDPPLDFHPSRQLYSYTIARGLYYKLAPDADPEIRERAIRAGEATDRYEPRVQEGILALIYLLVGGEKFWLARIMTSSFWLLGGWVLYRLASLIASSEGALFTLGYYLFLPLAIQGSRSLQPEVLMVMGVCGTAFALYQWTSNETWRWSLAAGFIGGLTALVKGQGVFPVAGMAFFTVVMTKGFVNALKDLRVWSMAAIMTAIPAFYYLGPWLPGGSGYFGLFTVQMSRLWRDPAFFVYWANFIHGFMDMGVIVLAIIGTLLMKMPGKAVSLGLWIGYLILGFFFPWQIHTHDYYSLVLVPIVALGLAPIGSRLVDGMRAQSWFWKSGFIVVCLFAIAYPAWTARSALLGRDFRNEPGAWRKMGEELPRGEKIIALTHDYGWRLQYWGYTHVRLWPYNADFELHAARGGNRGADSVAEFNRWTEGFDYFLVTAYGELDQQPQLKQVLEEFPIAQRGDGYILYDLNGQEEPTQ